MPKITVVLPVYNGEKYLRETLESILQQSFTDFEFLIIDDGSTDNSRAIINSFGDKRIRFLQNPKRLKLAGALNRGFKEAGGEYIARMDADDISHPQRLQKQLDFMEVNQHVGMCGSAIEIFGEDQTGRTDVYPASAEKIEAYALFDSPFCHPSTMLRKRVFHEHALLYDGSYYPTEDYELWTRALAKFPTANLSHVLLKYRVHSSSMTGSDWGQMDKQATRIIQKSLDSLGIDYREQELQLHRNIGRGRSFQFHDFELFEKAEKWLQKLSATNIVRKKYDQQALEETLALVWFRLCINNSGHGFSVLKKFTRSSLTIHDTEGRKRSMVLLISIFKKLLSPSRKVSS